MPLAAPLPLCLAPVLTGQSEALVDGRWVHTDHVAEAMMQMFMPGLAATGAGA